MTKATYSMAVLSEDESKVYDYQSVKEDYHEAFQNKCLEVRHGQIVRIEKDNDDGSMDIIAEYNPRYWERTCYYDGQTYGVFHEATLIYNSKIAKYSDDITYRMVLVNEMGGLLEIWYGFAAEEIEGKEEDEYPWDEDHIHTVEII